MDTSAEQVTQQVEQLAAKMDELKKQVRWRGAYPRQAHHRLGQWQHGPNLGPGCVLGQWAWVPVPDHADDRGGSSCAARRTEPAQQHPTRPPTHLYLPSPPPHTHQVEAVSGGIKELQTQAASFNKDAGKVRGNIAAADTALEAIRSARAALLESATLEQVRTDGLQV